MSNFKSFCKTNKIYHSRTEGGHFNKRKLPMPIWVLDKLNIKTGRINNAGYWIIRCPFHKNGAEEHPSLNIHQVQGNFRCHACAAKGGDILAFYMQYTKKSFVESAKNLRSWEY